MDVRNLKFKLDKNIKNYTFFLTFRRFELTFSFLIGIPLYICTNILNFNIIKMIIDMSLYTSGFV